MMQMVALTIIDEHAGEASVGTFLAVLLVAPLLCWSLVRWKRALIWLAAPLACCCAIICLVCVKEALVGTGYVWRHRPYPDWSYIGWGFAAAVFPAAAIRIAWLSPRKDRPPLLMPESRPVPDRRQPPGMARR